MGNKIMFFNGMRSATFHRRIVVVWIALMLLSGLARAGSVAVVLSSDAKPYQTAATVAEEQLNARGHAVKRLLLEEIQKDFTVVGEVDVFVAVGTKAAVWLQKKGDSSVGLVYCMVSDPERYGLTRGQPAYGVTTQIPIRPQFELIQECFPDARTIGLLTRSGSQVSKRLLQQAREALPGGWRLEIVDIDKYDSPSQAIDALFSRPIDIVWTSPDATVYQSATVRTLLLAAVRRKKPVFGFSLPFVRAGALLGVAVDSKTQGRQVADLAIRLIEAPSKDPVSHQAAVSPRTMAPQFAVAVNRIVADRLGLRLPASILRRAEYVLDAS